MCIDKECCLLTLKMSYHNNIVLVSCLLISTVFIHKFHITYYLIDYIILFINYHSFVGLGCWLSRIFSWVSMVMYFVRLLTAQVFDTDNIWLSFFYVFVFSLIIDFVFGYDVDGHDIQLWYRQWWYFVRILTVLIFGSWSVDVHDILSWYW